MYIYWSAQTHTELRKQGEPENHPFPLRSISLEGLGDGNASVNGKSAKSKFFSKRRRIYKIFVILFSFLSLFHLYCESIHHENSLTFEYCSHWIFFRD